MSLSDKHSLQLVDTEDGSQTILNTCLGSTYHSVHGAITESQHIFINEGLKKVLQIGVTEVTILEMGFGTGLSALLTAIHIRGRNVMVKYDSLELFPVPEIVWQDYRLPEKIVNETGLFQTLHRTGWGQPHLVTAEMLLHKNEISLLEFKLDKTYDLIYFDAFEPEKQPELWTEEVFGTIFSWMNPLGILTTYCCKGDVRRAMIKVGFEVEKIPGPPGKREIIRATKPL